MKETKHTPPPWNVARDHIHLSIYAGTEDTGGTVIATVINNCTPDEMEKNARLIATAPEMYDLLASIENDAGQVPDWLWDKIQECLVKADGVDVEAT